VNLPRSRYERTGTVATTRASSRPAHKGVREGFVQLLRCLTQGYCPDLLMAIRFGLGHAIDKNGDQSALRRAVSRKHFVQLAASIIVRAHMPELAEEIGIHNFSNGSPQEALPAAVRLAAEQHPSADVMIDIFSTHSSFDGEVVPELGRAGSASTTRPHRRALRAPRKAEGGHARRILQIYPQAGVSQSAVIPLIHGAMVDATTSTSGERPRQAAPAAAVAAAASPWCL
jgi:hypothetical protein